MASVSQPYGFRPVGYLSGRPYNGATRLIKIASGLASNIFNGDLVKMLSSGTIDKETGTTATTANAALGVFMGCTYTDPNLGYKVNRQFWPTGTVASDAYAYVADDPGLVFQVQGNGSLTQTNIGNNIAVVQGAGSTLIGKSRVSVDATGAGGTAPGTTNTLPFKIMGFVEGGGSANGDAFTDVLVIWNAGMHHYASATGI